MAPLLDFYLLNKLMNFNLNRRLGVVIFALAGALMVQGAVAQSKFDSSVHKATRKTGEAAHTVAVKTDTAAHRVGRATASTAKKVGHATASTAVKGASALTDKVYKGKEGPDGQTVYIDKSDKKYYVDDKGKKIYLKSSQIRTKKSD
jgi:hypothetical protein